MLHVLALAALAPTALAVVGWLGCGLVVMTREASALLGGGRG